MVGRVTASSAAFGPDGSCVRNQTSQYSEPEGPRIFTPCCCRVEANGRSAGGAPAGSILYWANASAVETANRGSSLFINDWIARGGMAMRGFGAGDRIR